MSESDNHTTRIFRPEDYQALVAAVQVLEDISLASRLANLVGMPIESVLKNLPATASSTIAKATDVALRRALDIAIMTMREGWYPASRRAHKVAATASGAIGGATGFAGIAVELPITTTIIFRSIADIARAEGEDLRDPATVLACLQVFGLGGPSKDDDGVESGYFAARVALSKMVQEATVYLARGAAEAEAPLLVRLATKLAARFGVVVSYKTAAQLAPVIGAVGGAVVNALFVDHFQSLAEGHFTVRRLERTYGPEIVRQAYMDILHKQPPGADYLPANQPGTKSIDTTAREVPDADKNQ